MANGDFPQWDNSDPKQSIDALFHWLMQKAQEQIAWYEKRRIPQKRWSQRTRWMSLGFATLGALCPLAAPMEFFKGGNLPEWGYVFLALGAMTVSFDRLYGFSSSWMRYASTQVNLDTALGEFRFDWALLLSQEHTSATALQKLKEFSARIDGIVKQETETWISEFRSNLAELEKTLKAGAEERKPGNVQLKIANARDFKTVSVALNNVPRKEMAGISEILIDLVPPGSHELLLTATDVNGRVHRETKVISVTANATTAVEVTIP